MIPGWYAYQPLPVGTLIAFDIGGNELGGVAVSLKEGMLTSEKIVIMRGPEMKQEIHVEPAFEALYRLTPFGYHGSIGIFLIKEGAYILP